MKTFFALIRLGRLHFLLGGVVLNLLGAAVALYDGAAFNLAALVWGQIAITAVQVMTHYANDYFDLNADRANATPTNWSGGSRVLVESALPVRSALLIALLFAGIAIAANLILSLFIAPGGLTFAILLLAQALAWFYSAPPVRLHSRGLGELTTMIVVTLLTPLTGYMLQVGGIGRLLLLTVAPLCLLQVAMLLSIEFPDAAGDAQVGKQTLVVRFGAKSAARLYLSLILASYAILPVLAAAGLPLIVALAVAAWSPLAGWQIWRVSRGDWRNPARWNGLAFYTIVLLVGTAVAELATWAILIGLK